MFKQGLRINHDNDGLIAVPSVIVSAWKKVINEPINVLSLPIRGPWNDDDNHRRYTRHSQLDLVLDYLYFV